MAASLHGTAALIGILTYISSFVGCVFIPRAHIPHSVIPGYIVGNVPFKGQEYSLEKSSSMDDISKLFAVLSNGDIVTISDISTLMGKTVDLVVHSKLGNTQWTDIVGLEIKESKNKLTFLQQKYEGHVLENSPVGSEVQGLGKICAGTHLYKPSEDKNIHYYIKSQSTPEAFSLKETYIHGIRHARLVTNTQLDREKLDKYTVVIEAKTDDSVVSPVQTTLNIIVDDQNDNIPKFDKNEYRVNLDQNTPIMSTLITLHASDPDDDVLYYSMKEHNVFQLDHHRGDILLKSKANLEPIEYILAVYARDSGDNPSVPAYVHINADEILRFESHRSKRDVRHLKTIDIAELYDQDIYVVTITSKERAAFKDPAPEMLKIDPMTAVVTLKDKKTKFDYEKQQEINFIVIITKIDDPSYRDEQPVKIRLQDLNDEFPRFVNLPEPFLATVSTNAPPGTSVYHLMGQDDDKDSDIKYILESGGDDRFEVDYDTGVVRTKGNQPFRLGMEYEIGVSCQDINAEFKQKSVKISSLKIYVGKRDPQFFETLYEAKVPETASESYKIVQIQAYSHQHYPITYELTTDSGGQSSEFAIDQTTGMVDLLRRLDYERDPQQYHLTVKAIENGRPMRTSTVKLIISLVDENDNTPTFPLSQYIVQGIAETASLGADIIQVTATDSDSVTNSQLTYSVSDNNFVVESFNNIGYIRTAKRLDYDSIPDHTYNFTVVATDNGTPSRSGSAMVRVTVTNVNDEAPVFMHPIEYVQVSEDATINTVVHVVQAHDPDGDDVTYSFSNGLEQGPFSIESHSGIIALRGPLDKRKVEYKLRITATDNGRCCGKTQSRSSQGTVIVQVKDINNNAPRFPDCSNYKPVVFEKEPVRTDVIQVQALDSDTGNNGNITYSLIKSSDQSSDHFTIEPYTGRLKTAEIFDRESKAFVRDYGVTVKAEDQGNPSLAGFCTFRVKIGDKNDNPPVFDLPQYKTSIEESSPIGKKVLQVYATDRDAGKNGEITYSIVEDPSYGFFKINERTGWIQIARGMSGRDRVILQIKAEDHGSPSKSSIVPVDFTITQTVNAYPQWVEDYQTQPIPVSENAPRDEIIKRLKAISTVPGSAYVNYVIQSGDTPEQNDPPAFHFKIDEISNDMLLMVYNPLDYELIPQYTLTIKAANRATNSLHNDTRIIIDLIDENDEIPQFVGLNENGRYSGSVAENLASGAEVISVTATDRDNRAEYSKVTYRLKQIYDYEKFAVDRDTGLITTVARFDREKQSEYYIMVVAEDGAKSDRPNHYPSGSPNQGEAEVQIRITDKNDNTPYFKKRQYTASVPENTDIGVVVMTVTAEDVDEENRLTYSIIGGNVGNAFEVDTDTGEIKVRGRLDFENGRKQYNLQYRVFDDKFSNSTTVVIYVTDVNDNPPKFENAIYNVTDIMEQEKGVASDKPKFILQVRATDPDLDRDSNIRYGLTGQFAKDKTFIIHEYSGEIYLTRPLDRDKPHGRPMWNFNVLAYDEPGTHHSMTGYAEVRVMPRDINDNAPVFDPNRLVGRVPEHSRADLSVLTVIANDNDEGQNGHVEYSLKQVPYKGIKPLFKIEPSTGLILTTLTDVLDREKQKEYHLIVQAKDKGRPQQSSSATVLIEVVDINDHKPQFTQKIYRATMSENLPKEASITSVSATDKDEGVNAKLTYILKEEDRGFFFMNTVDATNTGVLKVYQQVDYDTLSHPFFNLTVYVRDPDSRHMDTAYIEIFITDYNDNAPIFNPPSHKLTLAENATVGTTLYQFQASDKDTGENQLFAFSIDRSTDPDKQFSVDGTGVVTTAKRLDREKLAVHRINILAIDKGDPPQTGRGTLIVTLSDVNDNYPEFLHDYRPVVYENEPPGQEVAVIEATDKDTAGNGPPFEFWLPCRGRCPCKDNPTCGLFSFQFIPDRYPDYGGRDRGYGKGIVKSLATFDREKVKEFYMPIVMKDGGRPPVSGTNTLTIIIGDRNDNDHFPGHKDIFVYNYKESLGEFSNVLLGNVYAEDKDDWDTKDKIYEFTTSSPSHSFRLDRNTGELYTKNKISEGDYNFEVRVTDTKRHRDVDSTVSVKVREIGDDAVFSSGSLRLTGITAEEFVDRKKDPKTGQIGPSKYDILRSQIAAKLNIPTQNVDIFTVLNHPVNPETVDIRYAAHNSPYYRPARLDGVINENLDEFERVVGITIAGVPIDECLKESCESGGCSNTLITTSDPLVINTNGTSLIGVTAYIQAECTCAARVFTKEKLKCRPDSCLNGGTCVQLDNDFRCECRGDFDGPRCQQTRHSFKGNGWAWYEPLAQCEESHTRIEFLTDHDDGLILYNGPVRDPAQGDEEDFIILELRGGFPMLRINHGSGEAKLSVDGRDSKARRQLDPLSDGQWHRVDIFRDGRSVRMVVDQCSSAVVEENENEQSSSEDRRPCESVKETPGDNKFINVNTPLQLGGRANKAISYPRNVMKKGFTGCMRNLVHNGEIYDLHIGRVGQHFETEDGCSWEDFVCGANHIDGPACGVNGTCMGSMHADQYECVCNPGWRGPKCSIPTTTKDFREKSYIEWDFKDSFYTKIEMARHMTSLQLMFRTRQQGGLLFKAQNAHKYEYIKLEIRDYKIGFRYNLGSGELGLELSNVNASDGQWHTVKVERVGQWVTLKLDRGEGQYYNSTLGAPRGHLHIRVSQRSVFVGGEARYSSSNSLVFVDNDFKDSCINDIRYNGEWLPMDASQNSESDAADVKEEANLGDGCASDACLTKHCVDPLMCVDLWRLGECRCPVGQRRIEYSIVPACENINECISNPCIHGDCVDLPNGFICQCYPGYAGDLCPAKREARAAKVSMGAIIAILICLLVALLIILLIIIYSRRRRHPQPYVIGVDPDDDVRENIIHYDEEGVGEEDHNAYDIDRLKKPIDEHPKKHIMDEKPPPPAPPMRSDVPRKRAPPFKPGQNPDIANYINNRLEDANDDPNAPPHDSVREYAYEGNGSDAGSLSSIGSDDENDQDFDYLKNWGPRFGKLNEMFGTSIH